MVSVVMASYNGEKYILEQLKSIWKQTQKPDEIIISDDYSSDKTLQIIHKFQKETNAPIQLIYPTSHVGYVQNFFTALSAARGDVIFLCDQDDLWLQNKIEKCLSIFDENQEISVLSTGYTLIDAYGNPIYNKKRFFKNYIKKITLRKFLRHPKYPGMSLAIKREIIVEMLQRKQYNAAHDWQINWIAAQKKALFYYSGSLTLYRQHSANTVGIIRRSSKDKIVNQRISMLSSLESYLAPINIFPPEDKQYICCLKQVLEKRIYLLQNANAFWIFIYGILHLKYISLRSVLGDTYTIIHKER